MQTLEWQIVTTPNSLGKRYLKKIKVEVELDTEAKKGAGLLYVYSQYDKDLLDELRNLEKSTWNPEKKCWTVPVTERNNYALRRLATRKHAENYTAQVTPFEYDFRECMFDHQRDGFFFAASRRRCMLCFEMGLGKTLNAIELIKYGVTQGYYRWWLVAPKGAQAEWKRQLARWKAPFKFEVITTYESLSKHMTKADSPPQGVIFDESIKIKNPNSQRSQAAYELTRLMRSYYDDPYIVLLSGSPAPKDPTEWWHQIEVCQPGFLKEGTIHQLRASLADITYEDGPYGRYPSSIEYRERDLQLLGKRLSPIVLVKRKRECLDLPDKIYDVIECKPSPEHIRYAQVLAEQSASAIEALIKIREFSDGFQYETDDEDWSERRVNWVGSPKEKVIEELLDFYSDHGRLVIYAPFHATIDRICEAATGLDWTPLKIDGRGWSHKDALDLFDSDSDKRYCVVGNPASVHGISLQRTHALVYYSNNFDTDARIQSEDRRDRPGMDTSRGTRIVDIVHLPIDRYVLEIIRSNRRLQDLTIEEILEWLKLAEK